MQQLILGTYIHVSAAHYFPFLSRMSHCACVRVCASIEFSHRGKTKPLSASLWWDPDGKFQWIAHSANHYGSLNIFFPSKVACAPKYFYAAMDTFRLDPLYSLCTVIIEVNELDLLQPRGHFTLPCVDLQPNSIMPELWRAKHYLRSHSRQEKKRTVSFPGLPLDGWFAPPQTRSKGSLFIQDLLLRGRSWRD